MEYHYVKRHTSLFSNGVPLLEMNLLSTPKWHIIFSIRKLAIGLLVAFFMATASTHFVNSSVATSIHVYPSKGRFIGPMKSNPQLWKDMVP